MSTAANCRPVSLLFVVRKIVKKLGNYMPVDHLEECGLHSDFQRVFRSTTDLLVVVSYWNARAFDIFGATWAVALDISRAVKRVCMRVYLQNSSLMEFQVEYLTFVCLSQFVFTVLSLFVFHEWFWMQSLPKNVQLILAFLKALFLVLRISYNTLMTFLMLSVILLYMLIMLLLSTLSVIRLLICGNK